MKNIFISIIVTLLISSSVFANTFSDTTGYKPSKKLLDLDVKIEKLIRSLYQTEEGREKIKSLIDSLQSMYDKSEQSGKKLSDEKNYIFYSIFDSVNKGDQKYTKENTLNLGDSYNWSINIKETELSSDGYYKFVEVTRDGRDFKVHSYTTDKKGKNKKDTYSQDGYAFISGTDLGAGLSTEGLYVFSECYYQWEAIQQGQVCDEYKIPLEIVFGYKTEGMYKYMDDFEESFGNGYSYRTKFFKIYKNK